MLHNEVLFISIQRSSARAIRFGGSSEGACRWVITSTSLVDCHRRFQNIRNQHRKQEKRTGADSRFDCVRCALSHSRRIGTSFALVIIHQSQQLNATGSIIILYRPNKQSRWYQHHTQQAIKQHHPRHLWTSRPLSILFRTLQIHQRI